MNAAPQHDILIAIPTSAPLEAVTGVVEQVVGVRLHLHDSLHWGGDYYTDEEYDAEERIRVFPIFDIEEEAPFFEKVGDCPVLLGIDDTTRPTDELMRRLNGALGVECRLVYDKHRPAV